jgi:hypothetical protein
VRSPSGRCLVIQGERKVETKLCTIVEAAKRASNGGETYLAYVVDSSVSVLTLSVMPVVNEYPDVFPGNLPGLPPERKIDFQIELIQEARSVAKAPCRLAPTEIAGFDEPICKSYWTRVLYALAYPRGEHLSCL